MDTIDPDQMRIPMIIMIIQDLRIVMDMDTIVLITIHHIITHQSGIHHHTMITITDTKYLI